MNCASRNRLERKMGQTTTAAVDKVREMYSDSENDETHSSDSENKTPIGLTNANTKKLQQNKLDKGDFI